MREPAPLLPEIKRYLSYGWEWRIITAVVNYKHDLTFRPDELRKLHDQRPQELEQMRVI